MLTIAIPGVLNWRGKIGKIGGPNGEQLIEMGPIPDLERIDWKRDATIMLNYSKGQFTSGDQPNSGHAP